DGQWEILERIGDEERNDLFGKLVGAVGVRPTGDEGGQAEAGVVGLDEHLATRLRCRIGAPRSQAVAFLASPVLDVAVDLVRTHLEEALVAVLASGLEQDVRSVDVGLNECPGVK